MATLKSEHSLEPLAKTIKLLRTPTPPYYAVISTNIHNSENLDSYNALLKETLEIANKHEGYLGMESAKERLENKLLYTVATLYFSTEEAIEAWRSDPDHLKVKKGARKRWFTEHNIRICKVLKHYGSNLTHR